MNIIIHGTKGGHRVFYSSPNSPAIAGDSRSASSSENPVGKSAYSIAYTSNGCMLTKYVIVRDLIRNMSTGNVAFSVYLPNDQKLSGTDVKSLLDKLSNHYCAQYAPENNLDNVNEDWSFVEKISSSFIIKHVSSYNTEKIQQGNVDAAFVYYSSEEELQKYFDAPFQEEYSNYKQIFFVSNDLQNKPENPLNALHHSGNNLTGKIDLENPTYTILFNNNAKGGVKIDVKLNGSSRSNKNKIRRKNDLEITWSKPYHKTVVQLGKYYEISPEYIVVDNDERTVSIKEIELLDDEKTITLEIKDRKGNPVTDPEIQIVTQYGHKITQLTTILSFRGEDIGKHCTVLVKKGDNLFSDPVFLTPEKQIGTLIINLKERKKIEITATNDNGIVYDFIVQIRGKVNNIRTREIEFIDDEIDKTWDIEISKNEKGVYYSGEAQFCPNSDNKVHIQLKKGRYSPPKPQSFRINAGEHGTISPYCPEYSYHINGNDIDKKLIKPVKGYSFKGWKLNNDSGTLIAQYDKKKSFFRKKNIIIGLIVSVIIYLVLVIWVAFFSTKSDNPKPPINKFKIQMYVESDSLFYEKLNILKSNWEKQKPEESEKGGGILNLFIKSKKQPDIAKINEWEKTNENIINAIKKRELIDAYNFSELKKQHYSAQQQQFKITLEKIDSEKYKEVGTRLGNVSALTLNQIAYKIDSIVKALNSQENIQSGRTTDEHQENANAQNIPANENSTRSNSSGTGANSNSGSGKAGSTTSNNNSRSSSGNRTGNQQNHQQISADKITEIKQYLKGNELNEQRLDEYKKTSGISDPLKASIRLCLDFWELDASGSDKNAKTYYSFRKKIDADENLKDSKLKTFIEKMCDKKENPNPSYRKQDKIKGLKKI
jgi:hypothetical protein